MAARSVCLVFDRSYLNNYRNVCQVAVDAHWYCTSLLPGAHINTTESVILSLAGDAAHPDCKEIQKIIKEINPDTGLVSHRESKL